MPVADVHRARQNPPLARRHRFQDEARGGERERQCFPAKLRQRESVTAIPRPVRFIHET